MIYSTCDFKDYDNGNLRKEPCVDVGDTHGK